MLSLLQRGTSQALLQAQTKQWLAAHDKRLPLPPLSPKVLAFIKEWYFLVDTDGSGELSLDEVAAAMKVIWLTCLMLGLCVAFTSYNQADSQSRM